MKDNSPEFKEAFAYVEKVVRRRMRRYKDLTDCEDATQEALIWVWKALREDRHLNALNGLDHLAYRAQMEGHGYLFDKRRHATGHPGMDRVATPRKYPQGEATREKIRNYMNEYKDLHGVEPSSYQIAEAIGMNSSGVRNHLRAMKTGKYTQIEWETVPLVEEYGADGDEYAKIPTVESFEDELLGEMAIVRELLDNLSQKHVEMLYAIFWEGYTIGEYAKTQGWKTSTAYSHRHKALKTLREARQ